MFFLVSCPKRNFESTIEIMHRFFLPTVQYLDRQENLINASSYFKGRGEEFL